MLTECSLQALSKKLSKGLYHTAGLNPLMFRRQRAQPNSKPRQTAPANMLDGELLWRFTEV
jgi:hypothetical protein